MASADIYTTATQLAILASGRAPVWTTQDDSGSEGPPDTGLAGIALQGAMRTLVHVSLREAAHRRTARLSIPTPDLTCNYTVTVNGNAVVYDATADGAADLQDLLTGIRDEINGDVTVGALVTATVVDTTGGSTPNAVLVVGDAEADYTIDFTQDSAAVVACEADLARAVLRLWWLMAARVGSTPPAVWAWSQETWTIDRRGYVERFDSAGMDRLHVQLDERTGVPGDGDIVTYTDPVISVGPCLSEVEV